MTGQSHGFNVNKERKETNKNDFYDCPITSTGEPIKRAINH